MSSRDKAVKAFRHAVKLHDTAQALRLVRESLCDLGWPDTDTLLTINRLCQAVEVMADEAEIKAHVAHETAMVETHKRTQGRLDLRDEYCPI